MKAINFILCLLILMPNALMAKQISFSKQPQEDHYRFNYEWIDHDKQPQSMRFDLTKPALFERFRMLRAYQGKFAQKAILRAVRKELKSTPLKGAQVVFNQQDGQTILQVKGLVDAEVTLGYQKVKEIEKSATDAFFKENYFQPFITHDNVSAIKLDHVSIANDSVADLKALKPIVLEKVSIQNIRAVTNFVLSFVQSIPYSTLESRISSSGAGFNPPAKLLWENQGDCDSKVTLTAAILRALMPRIDMAMVFIDQHAFIGIAVPANAGEMTIEHQGINYLLGEPTGPAQYRLGKLAPDSELAVNQGRYVAQKFHSDGTF